MPIIWCEILREIPCKEMPMLKLQCYQRSVRKSLGIIGALGRDFMMKFIRELCLNLA